MTAPCRDFSPAEYRDRVARLQTGREAAGIDALLLTTEPDVRYIKGVFTRFWKSSTRPWFVVVPLPGDPVAVIPAIGADLMARTWLDDTRTWTTLGAGQTGDLRQSGSGLADGGASRYAAVRHPLRPADGRVAAQAVSPALPAAKILHPLAPASRGDRSCC